MSNFPQTTLIFQYNLNSFTLVRSTGIVTLIVESTASSSVEPEEGLSTRAENTSEINVEPDRNVEMMLFCEMIMSIDVLGSTLNSPEFRVNEVLPTLYVFGSETASTR